MAPTKPAKITERTYVPISLLCVIIGAIVSVVFWASGIAARAERANEKVDKLEVSLDAIPEIQTKVGRIEMRVDMIYDAIREHEGKK